MRRNNRKVLPIEDGAYFVNAHRAVSGSKGKDQFFITSIEVSFIEARSFEFVFIKHISNFGEK